MTILYTELARVYHEMYLTLFDYEREFQFFHELLERYASRSVVELGCGSGNLAPYFLEHGYEYRGVDIAPEMLKIAREVVPHAAFCQGDMRSFKLDDPVDAAIITGRSTSYLLTNEDVRNALRCIREALRENGFLIFDAFRAESVIVGSKTEFIHEATFGDRSYKRISRKSRNLQTGWTWNWDAEYQIDEPGKPTRIVKDSSVLRAFTEQELRLFLTLEQFDLVDVIKDETFAFVARKRS